MPRQDNSRLFDNILGCALLISGASFLGLIYYACEAYPSVVRTEAIDPTHASVTLKVGSLCDSPEKLIREFQDKNPQIEVEGFLLDTEWGQRVLKINFKKR